MKLLQRICLLAAVPAVLALCILRTPLHFGADSSAFSDAVPASYEVGGEAVEARETTLPQGQNELHLRSWTRNGEDVCVMGSFQTAPAQFGRLKSRTRHSPCAGLTGRSGTRSR